MKKTLFALAAAVGALVVVTAALGAGTTPVKHASYTIVHVQKGCHVWVVGGKQLASSRVQLARGGIVAVLNQDIDGHKLVQLAGPAKLHLAALKMNGRATIRFTKPGVYRLGTKPFEMKGAPMVETIGPDHVLRLTVVVS